MRPYSIAWQEKHLHKGLQSNMANCCRLAEENARKLGRDNTLAVINKILATTPEAQRAYVAETLHKITGV